MKAKKGLKIIGTTLGAIALTATVVCCYGPAPQVLEDGSPAFTVETVAPDSNQTTETNNLAEEAKE